MANPKGFISYSRKDRSYVDRLVAALQNLDMEVWFDYHLLSGQDWDDTLEAQIKTTDYMIIVLSKTSVASDNVKNEMRFAMDHGKTIHPILMEKCSVPLSMRRMHYIDFESLGFEKGIEYLVRDIKQNHDNSGIDSNKNITSNQEQLTDALTSTRNAKRTLKKMPLILMTILVLAALGIWQFWPKEHKTIDQPIEVAKQKAYEVISNNWFGAFSDRFYVKKSSTVAFFQTGINSETGDFGDSSTESILDTTQMFVKARANGQKTLLSIYLDTNKNSFLKNSQARTKSISTILQTLWTKDINGLKLYISDISADSRDFFTTYIIELKEAFKKANSKKELYLVLPFENNQSIDIATLNPYVDYFILGQKEIKSSSELPINYFEEWKNTIKGYLDKGVDASKFIISISYQGILWELRNEKDSPKPKYIFKNEWSLDDIGKDRINMASYDEERNLMVTKIELKYRKYDGTAGTTNNEIWFDNEITLGKKYDFIIDQNLAGIDVFTRDFKKEHVELTNLILEKFVVDSLKPL